MGSQLSRMNVSVLTKLSVNWIILLSKKGLYQFKLNSYCEEHYILVIENFK